MTRCPKPTRLRGIASGGVSGENGIAGFRRRIGLPDPVPVTGCTEAVSSVEKPASPNPAGVEGRCMIPIASVDGCTAGVTAASGALENNCVGASSILELDVGSSVKSAWLVAADVAEGKLGGLSFCTLRRCESLAFTLRAWPGAG